MPIDIFFLLSAKKKIFIISCNYILFKNIILLNFTKNTILPRKLLFIFAFIFICQKILLANDTIIIEPKNKHIPVIPILKHITYFEDKNGTYNLADVIKQPIQDQFQKPTKKILNFGFSKSAYWLKFDIKNETFETRHYIFSINYPLINIVEFYGYCNGELIKSIKTGDYKPYKSRNINNPNFVFHLTLEPNKTYHFYTYINNHGETLRVPIDLMEYNTYMTDYSNYQIFKGFFYGALLFIIIFNFFLFFTIRDKIYLYTALYVGFLVLFMFCIDGISYKYFWPGEPWLANHSIILSATLANVFLIQFIISFLNTRRFLPTLHKFLKYYQYFGLGILALSLFSGIIFTIAVKLTNIYSATTSILAITISILSILRKNKLAYYIFISFLLFTLTVVLYVLRNIGVVFDNNMVDIGFKTGLTLEMLILSFAVSDRFRRIKEQSNQNLEKLIFQRTEEIQSQSEEILQQAEQLAVANRKLEKLSLVASETDNGVTIFNNDGRIEYQNTGFTKLYGYSYKTKFDDKIADIYELINNPKLPDLLSKCNKIKKSIVFETETKNIQNKNIWIQTTITPIFDERHQIKKYIAIDTDITAIKNAEEIIENKNRNITASIRSAQLIQQAILPPNHIIKKLLPNPFIVYKPKDIVSGDFYWVERKEHNLLFAAVDCTGHGVPGALMSVIGFSVLNQAVKETKLVKPADVLDFLNRGITMMLRLTNEDTSIKEGMDIALCNLNYEAMVLEYAGAHNPLYLIRDNTLIEFKSDMQPVGVYYAGAAKKFTSHEIKLRKNDAIYIFSDGYSDQFGGTEHKKFLKKNFRELLLKIHHLPPAEQKQMLEKTFEDWKGNDEQTDDVLVFGIKI